MSKYQKLTLRLIIMSVMSLSVAALPDYFPKVFGGPFM